MTGLLFGIEAWDPPTFVGTAVLLGSVCVAAAAVPAFRAAQVDPMLALREE